MLTDLPNIEGVFLHLIRKDLAGDANLTGNMVEAILEALGKGDKEVRQICWDVLITVVNCQGENVCPVTMRAINCVADQSVITMISHAFEMDEDLDVRQLLQLVKEGMSFASAILSKLIMQQLRSLHKLSRPK